MTPAGPEGLGGTGRGEGGPAARAPEGVRFLSVSSALSRARPLIPPVDNLFLNFFPLLLASFQLLF